MLHGCCTELDCSESVRGVGPGVEEDEVEVLEEQELCVPHEARDLVRSVRILGVGQPVSHPHANSGARAQAGRWISEHATTRLLSTGIVLEQEQRLLDWAAKAVGHVPAVEPAARQDAVAAAIGGHDNLVLVIGPAGAGKTTATRAGVDRLRTDLRPVLGLASSGKAADVLAQAAGCPAITMAKLLHAARRSQTLPPAGTTVILDSCRHRDYADA